MEIGTNSPMSVLRGLLPRGVDYYYGDITNPAGAVKFTDEYTIDVPDDEFDVVFHANTIEHVRQIWRWLKEQVRILKPGGRLIVIAPLSFPFHEVPIDCWRIYPDGIRALFDYAGLACNLAICENLDGGRCDELDMCAKRYGFDEKKRIQGIFCKGELAPLPDDMRRMNRAWDWETLDTIGIGTKM